MPDIAASIEVPAPRATVWRVLMDVDAYPQWNTLLRVSGEYVPDGDVSARLSVPGLPTVPLRPTIVTVDPERELRWRSRIFGHSAEHAFLLETTADDASTRFVQEEHIDGPLAGPLIGPFERRMRRGFEQMNLGLRRRCRELTEP